MKWQSTPVFLPREFHGWKNLVCHSPCGHKESDTAERLHTDVNKSEQYVNYLTIKTQRLSSAHFSSIKLNNYWLRVLRKSMNSKLKGENKTKIVENNGSRSKGRILMLS